MTGPGLTSGLASSARQGRSAPLVVAALAALLVCGSAISWLMAGDGARPAAHLTLGLVAGLAGVLAGARWSVQALVAPVALAALVLTALLFGTALGSPELGAYRTVQLGLPVQPAPFWVLAAQLAAVAAAGGDRRARGWLAVALAGCLASAWAMRELSVVPQTAAALVAITFSVGRYGLVLVTLAVTGLVVALSAGLPYVKRRWVGWLDPDGHARGAGWDYQALRRTVQGSRWLGPAEAPLPRVSSPFADYWLASAMWRLGRLPVLGWTLGLAATLVAAGAPTLRGPAGPGVLLTRAVAAGMLASLAIHVAYNVGLMPVTAVDPPLAGPGGASVALQLFALCFGLSHRGEAAR